MLVKTDELLVFLRECAEQKLGNIDEIIVPTRSSAQPDGPYLFDSILSKKEVSLDGYRTIDPARMLFYLFREQVLNKKYPDKQRIIAGIKACDLKSIFLLDKALIDDDFVDPSYKHWREHTTIISNDCSEIYSTCHCNLTDNEPFARDGFDLNLSRIDDSYFITIGSENGQNLIDLFNKHLTIKKTINGETEKINANRKTILDMLDKQNKPFNSSSNYSHLNILAHEQWTDPSKECVGCGSCTNICPTCYCLILNDESVSEKFIKVRSSDSCQINGYARVAGGGTPRPQMTQRFQNRYLCKFQNMQSNFNEIGCTGCGRCIDACPAGIDFRQVVQQMASKSQQKISDVSTEDTQLVREEV